MNEITIKQYREVTGESYPTALRRAKKVGRYDPDIPPRGMWYIPYDFLALEVQRRMTSVRKMQERFLSLEDGG